MILSASRRTDIPCFFSDWMMNRIRAGYVKTRNPMNPRQIRQIDLSPEKIDCIVFWTKDAANILPYLTELDERGYKYYFQFTVTPYGREIEPGLRSKMEIEKTFIALSEHVGRERVVWRYDPILFHSDVDLVYHKNAFLDMCETFSSYTDTVTISFVDSYSKRKSGCFRPPLESEITEFAEYAGQTARRYGLRCVACCESNDLQKFGIEPSCCIDHARISKICGYPVMPGPDRSQRSGCGCCKSVDIGAYDTCLNGCVYCYANRYRRERILHRLRAHDPQGEFLIPVEER